MKKVLCIIGESATGKDTLKEELLKQNDHCVSVVRHTTRPKRDGEINGVTYHFINNEEFSKLIMDFSMLEANLFKGWAYGTAYDSLVDNKINIITCDSMAAENLSQCKDLYVEIAWIQTAPKLRLIRALTREENVDVDEVLRRFTRDNEDYADFAKNNLKNCHIFHNDSLEDFNNTLQSLNDIVEMLYE